MNVEEYNNPNLFAVGLWFYQNQKNFDEIQKQKLRELGYILKGEEEDKFEKHYGLLVKLKEQGEDPNLTNKDKIRINEDGTISIITMKKL